MGHSRAHIARAALEGVAFCLADVWQVVGGAETAILTGGITRSPAWAQIVCDVLGVPLGLMEAADASAVGAARLGFTALGESVSPPPQPAATLTPDLAIHRRYVDLHGAFQERYRRNFVE